MAPLALTENGRKKFTGNVTMYEEIYRYRQRVFLVRNVNAVLDMSNKQKRLRQTTMELDTSGEHDERSPSVATQPRPRKTIGQIWNDLQPAKPAPGSRSESRLRVIVNYLKRSRQPTPRHVPFPVRHGTSFTCRVKLTIWYLQNGTATEDPGIEEQLLCESETCTVSIDDDESATIEMDDWFVIKHGKLCVQLQDAFGRYDFRMAAGYRYELCLSSIDENRSWPPFSAWPPPTMQRSHPAANSDPVKVELVVRIDAPGGRTPSLSEHKAFFRIPGSSEMIPANLSLGTDFGWYHPDHPRFSQSAAVTPPRPLTPDSASPALRGNLTILTYYTFCAPVENSRSWYGPPDLKGQHSFGVLGYACVFCDGRQFPDCSYLHFHLVTAHELLSFKVKSSARPMTGLRSGTQNHDRYVEVIVDLSKEGPVRASNDVPDHRDFRWVRPLKPLDVQRILRGDWSWLNQKKSPGILGLRRDGTEETSAVLPERKIDWKNIPAIPERQRRKFRVKKPRMLKPRKRIYLRTQSKRYMEVGEYLSESDDDVDEEWLVRKHDETICDFEDIASNEHEFMKLWDRHMFEERIVAYYHVGPSLIRFAQKHKELLRESPLLVEFWKHCLNQLQFRTIDAEALRMVMEEIKGGKEEWSSVGKSQWGLGINGPYIHDVPLEESPAQMQTPTSRKKGKGKATKAADAMDIDEPSTRKDLAVGASRAKESKTEIQTGMCKQECGMPWHRSDMVRCCGKNCDATWHHRSCYPDEKLGRWVQGWVCPKCR
ncbi:hypothetical protein FN846DRAFT_449796 [Sphaerosporella brunnea]|uniref:Polycomb protein VEFS-Box domain-containing protein n=1 Tax=Sphaerosporella brunnea TaxID=1250544 RepID=A0A5J5F4Q9_9PEZI|nr:hypothetical protein FN846DRAFT_449796 [Sphaerosporella brunnea]